jgi:hypothetical protein
MKTAATITLVLCVALSGCFRTTYRNFGIAAAPPPVGTATTQVSNEEWRIFGFYGWSPREMLIPADDICKSAGGVQEIRTRRTFFQALLWALQVGWTGVDLYSPYYGAVVCAGDSGNATD